VILEVFLFIQLFLSFQILMTTNVTIAQPMNVQRWNRRIALIFLYPQRYLLVCGQCHGPSFCPRELSCVGCWMCPTAWMKGCEICNSYLDYIHGPLCGVNVQEATNNTIHFEGCVVSYIDVLQHVVIWVLVYSDELWLLLTKCGCIYMNMSINYKWQKDFIYEINLMEQAANKMSRTGYKMKWDCWPHR